MNIPTLTRSVSWEWRLLITIVVGSFVLGAVFGG